MFKNYFKIALRNVLKYKSLSFINITGLVIGLTCAIFIFLWIQYEYSYDQFHTNKNNLYRVVFTNETGDFYGYYQPGPLAEHLVEVIPEITHATSYSEMQWKLSREEQGFFCIGSFVENDFFDMFSFPLLKGNIKTLFDDPASVVLSETLAHKLFGQTDPLGGTVQLNNGQSLHVSGVMQDIPQNSHMQFEFLMSLKIAPDWMKQWNLKSTTTYAMVSPQSSIRQVNGKIYGLMNEQNPGWKNVLFLRPFTKSHLYNLGGKGFWSFMDSGLITYVYIFMVMGIVILLIACINFINLTTAYSERRAKEIGVRKTVGSSRFAIMMQFLGEAVLFAIFAMIMSLILVELALPYITNLLGKPLDMGLTGDFLLPLLGLTILTGIGAGLYPAIHFSRVRPVRMLTNSSRTGAGGQSPLLRKGLVVVQFTLSIFFIISLLGIRQQLVFIQSKDLGYTKDCVLMIQTRGALNQKTPLVKKALLQQPAIQSVTVSGNDLISLQGTGSGPVEWPDKDNEDVVEAGFNMVDFDYVETLKMNLAQGRFFSRDFETDWSEAFVVNETAIRRMGFTNPIEQEITINQGNYTRTGRIIGVVKDFHAGSLHQTVYPMVVMLTDRANYMFVRMEAHRLTETLQRIKDTIKAHVPDDPFHYEFLDKKIENLYRMEQLTGTLTIYLTVLMLLISCLGLFGLTSFSTQQRTKEIGIRKVFGASVSHILLIISQDMLKWVLLANFIAWPIAWFAMNKWLENFSYRIDLTIWPFLLSGLIALLIALVTVSWQAIRAARANPVEALRYE
jgi:putative ABC transport system permease protein